MSRGIPILAAVLAMVSCSDPVGVAEANGLRVQMRADGLVVENRTGSDVYYKAIDGSVAAYTEWVGCGALPVENPASECEFSIPRGGTKAVARTDITGWGTSQSVIFYWWHMVPVSGGGWTQGSIRSLAVSR